MTGMTDFVGMDKFALDIVGVGVSWTDASSALYEDKGR